MNMSAVGPTSEYLAAASASANYAMDQYQALKPEFAAMAIGALIEQTCGSEPSLQCSDIEQGGQIESAQSIPILADHGISRA